jgi:polygalacturonase
MLVSTNKSLKSFLIKVLLVTVLLGFTQLFCQQKSDKTGWDAVPEIISQIKVPVFPDRDYDVTDFGAVGDSVTTCFKAFKEAIDKCNQQGGGRVIVPKGKYFLNGPIHLKSNVNLYLVEGARLEFSTNAADYLPMVLTKWEGIELFNYSPFIYAYQATNVAITGLGIIDGNAKNSFATWKLEQKEDKKLIRKMGNDGVPVYERLFGEGHKVRPSTIQFYSCKNILVEGITVLDAPFWVIHPTLSINITIRNVTVNSWNPNNDGVDPDGCVNVLIENCEFNCSDDAVAIKSGRDQDGWRIGQPTENVIVRNCTMNSEANGLCIGSEMSGSVRNIFMENCQIGNASSTIYFKGNLDRGGIVENVYVRNIKVERARTAFIRFDSNYKGHRGNHFPPLFRNFHIENVHCQMADHYGLYFKGVEDTPIRNIVLKDVTVLKAEIPTFTQYVTGVSLKNVKINNSEITELPFYQEPAESDKEITW